MTLWLNFSYNRSVNLLQILHLYIHPTTTPFCTRTLDFTVSWENTYFYASFSCLRFPHKDIRKKLSFLVSFARCNRSTRPWLSERYPTMTSHLMHSWVVPIVSKGNGWTCFSEAGKVEKSILPGNHTGTFITGTACSASLSLYLNVCFAREVVCLNTSIR